MEDIGNDIKKERVSFALESIFERGEEKKNERILGCARLTRGCNSSFSSTAKKLCEKKMRDGNANESKGAWTGLERIATLDLPFVINILFCTSINIACLMGEKRKKKKKGGRGEKETHLLIERSLRGTPFIRLCRFDSILFLLSFHVPFLSLPHRLPFPRPSSLPKVISFDRTRVNLHSHFEGWARSTAPTIVSVVTAPILPRYEGIVRGIPLNDARPIVFVFTENRRPIASSVTKRAFHAPEDRLIYTPG